MSIYKILIIHPSFLYHNDHVKYTSSDGNSDTNGGKLGESEKDFSEKMGLDIEIVEDFRERKVDSVWIDDFTSFTKNQWSDFTYKLSDGECLLEVQSRNISALAILLERCKGKNIVIGGHGTALSTIINYYDPSFGYDDFEKMKYKMPWIVEMHFDDEGSCDAIYTHDLD